MTYTEINKLAINPNFLRIVKVAIIKTASQTAGEDSSTMNPGRGNKRHSYSASVLANPEGQAKVFALHCACLELVSVNINGDGTLNYTGGSDIDTEVQSVVESMWDTCSGVLFSEKD